MPVQQRQTPIELCQWIEARLESITLNLDFIGAYEAKQRSTRNQQPQVYLWFHSDHVLEICAQALGVKEIDLDPFRQSRISVSLPAIRSLVSPYLSNEGSASVNILRLFFGLVMAYEWLSYALQDVSSDITVPVVKQIQEFTRALIPFVKSPSGDALQSVRQFLQ